MYLVDLDLSSLLAASGSKQHQQQQQTKSQQVQDLSQQEGAAVPTALQFALPDGNTVALTVSNLVASNHNNKAAFTASSKASGQSDATSKSAQDQAPKDGQQQQQQAPKPLCAKRLKGKGEDVCLEQQQQGASAAVTEECETWEGVGAKGTGGSSGVFTRCGESYVCGLHCAAGDASIAWCSRSGAYLPVPTHARACGAGRSFLSQLCVVVSVTTRVVAHGVAAPSPTAVLRLPTHLFVIN